MTATKPKSALPDGSALPAAPVPSLTASVATEALRAWMDLGTEAVRFAWGRLQQDLKAQQAVLACRSLDELRKVQADFLRSAREDYADEARRMFALLGKATTAGLAVPARGRRYDDVPV